MALLCILIHSHSLLCTRMHHGTRMHWLALACTLTPFSFPSPQEARGQEASQQLGTGDRSAKIRTYNFKDGRVTDHRVGLVLYKLSEVLKGEALGELVDAMGREERRRRAEELVGAMGGRARGGEGG